MSGNELFCIKVKQMKEQIFYERSSVGRQMIYGTSILSNPICSAENGIVHFDGHGLAGGRTGFSLGGDVLNKHLLLLGGSGCGKTTTFYYIIRDIREQMNENDIMVIFDTKGEFYEKFGRDGDIVIGSGTGFREKSASWNIFGEVTADGFERTDVKINAREIAASLFHGRGSSSQPFFCNAARDIFAGILEHFVRMAVYDPELWMPRLNNYNLAEAIRIMKAKNYIDIFSAYKDMHYMLSYFGDGKSNQALGVFGELNNMFSDHFIGIFAEHKPWNSVSMRRAVRERKGRAVFIEYDLSIGETLTPVYRLLVDQALKEALGRNASSEKTAKRLYLIADEFKLLPKLQHIDDALNFGRGLGINVVAGIQSIDQLYDVYGKEKGSVIAGGFGSMFAYRTNDASSRNYITERFGKNVSIHSYINSANDTPYNIEREGNTAEDWEQIGLDVGQAIIGLGKNDPFLFRFKEYK